MIMYVALRVSEFRMEISLLLFWLVSAFSKVRAVLAPALCDVIENNPCNTKHGHVLIALSC